MAEIEIQERLGEQIRVLINGMDVTSSLIHNSIEVIRVGDDPDWQEWGVRMTFGVTKLSTFDQVGVEAAEAAARREGRKRP